MIKFYVLNRWSLKIQFTAEIDCTEDAPAGIKMGLAVRWAYKSDAANLRDANLRYADLSDANLFGADLSGTNLRYANLRGADLSGTNLRYANLRGADLSDANLRDADLRGADLSGTNLRYANLRGADLRGIGVPVVPHIDAAILKAIDAGGKLNMSVWHHCGTTHCRAGWAITLAGDAGRALEFGLGSAAAGALIYAASRPGEKVPDFYCDDAKALADLKAGAERDPLPQEYRRP